MSSGKQFFDNHARNQKEILVLANNNIVAKLKLIWSGMLWHAYLFYNNNMKHKRHRYKDDVAAALLHEALGYDIANGISENTEIMLYDAIKNHIAGDFMAVSWNDIVDSRKKG